MSTLYLAGDPLPLATKLADLLGEQARPDDPFAPTQVVVPNRTLEKWLQLFLARRQGIAINLHFGFLEKSLWEMLRAVDPRTEVAAPELLDGDLYRLLVLAVLLEETNPALANLRGYFRGLEGTAGRRSWRRAWHLADMLGNCIRDYEYHRQDRLIQPWLKGELVLGEAFAEVERAQQAVFSHIIDEVHGRRARVSTKKRDETSRPCLNMRWKCWRSSALVLWLESLQQSPAGWSPDAQYICSAWPKSPPCT